MRTQSSDTSLEAEKVHIELLRKVGVVRRFNLMRSLTATTRRLSWQSLGRVRPDQTLTEKRVWFAGLLYGEEIAQGLRVELQQLEKAPEVMNEDVLAAIKPVVEALEALGVAYLIGGSIASSIHGIPRSTNDADLVADLAEGQVAEFISRLKETYYLDEAAIRAAIVQHSSFNLIHFDSVVKIDIFVLKNESFHQTTFERREPIELDKSDPHRFNVYTPEDIILHKLVWYDSAGRVSEKQWLDILGVLKMQGERLNRSYLIEWSEKLGLADLMKQAFEDTDL